MLYNIWVSSEYPGHKDNLVWCKNIEGAIYWFEEADELLYGDSINLWTDKNTNHFVNWFLDWNKVFNHNYRLKTIAERPV